VAICRRHLLTWLQRIWPIFRSFFVPFGTVPLQHPLVAKVHLQFSVARHQFEHCRDRQIHDQAQLSAANGIYAITPGTEQEALKQEPGRRLVAESELAKNWENARRSSL
jgi:hypothetical protein